ncbi:hypothetical protein LTR84_007547 [Exophiala bonariae]|uniref:Uncharacterized protein n=1 Tax=Exophiala bonariae TaxID=1690606 RepID=A0AAV9NM15_9EURO|nr:hypothetical protein LTR84_007547 [Exophiala bonariae]
MLRTATDVRASISSDFTSDVHSPKCISGVGRPLDDQPSTERLSRRTIRNRSLLATSAHGTLESADPVDLAPLSPLPTSSSSVQESLNPKEVYCAENSAYWTGRYVSVCDRLRMEELDGMDFADNQSDERLWESKDRLRVENAINELRGFCRTTQAQDSFARFETQLFQELKTNVFVLTPKALRSKTEVQDEVSKFAGPELKSKSIWTSPSSIETASISTSRVSSVNAEATLAVGPKLFYGRAGITKSKTTGHLASLLPMIQTRSTTTTSNTPRQGSTEPLSHRRRTSFFDCSPQTRARAMKEREDRAARRVAEVRRRLEAQSLTTSKTSDNQPRPCTTITTPQSPQSHRAYPLAMPATGRNGGAFSGSTLAGGRNDTKSSARSARIVCTRVDMHAQTAGAEKLERGRRKAERQFSGEIVKSLFGAGMRGMKKMRKRVGGGMVWSGSHEDLSSSSDR